jgi:dihydroflavonol-4-reductase
VPAPAATPLAPEPASRRRILVTGASGFVGRQVAQLLLDRGDRVVALVRDAKRVGDLADSGAEVVEDDHADVGRLAALLHDVDGAIHAAGSYRVGIRKEERGAMWDANVGVTTRFLDAAELARTPRIVYVSTVNVFGNTRGLIVDESHRRNLGDGFLSWYDETKYGAHEVAEQRIRSRAPIVIVMPSQVYGPRDQSGFGDQLRDANRGRLRYRAVDDLGVGLVHVEDLAAGIVAALDRGVTGHSYVLSGPTTTLRQAVEVAARVGGRRPPRLRVPTRLLRAMAPVGSIIGQPNLREVLSASAGVTYWATSAKAEQELGFRPRDIETGFADTFGRP